MTGKNRVDLVLLPVSEILKTVPRTNDGKDESRVCGAHHDGAIDVPRARCRRPVTAAELARTLEVQNARFAAMSRN